MSGLSFCLSLPGQYTLLITQYLFLHLCWGLECSAGSPRHRSGCSWVGNGSSRRRFGRGSAPRCPQYGSEHGCKGHKTTTTKFIYMHKINKNQKQQNLTLQSGPVCWLVPSRKPEMHMDLPPADKKMDQIMVSIGSLGLIPVSCNGRKDIWFGCSEWLKKTTTIF